MFFLGIALLGLGLALTLSTCAGFFGNDDADLDPGYPAPNAPHIDLSDFAAGNLISDRVMFDYQSMTQEQIAAFIAQQNAGCQTGQAPCLADYVEDTVEVPASARCDGYAAGVGETAAQIIYKTAQACRVNPQVLLVLLQKEQGLLTASGSALSTQRYLTATGYGCPDGQNCDSQYFGFATQVYSAASQFQRYRLEPWLFSYRAGGTYDIAYSPDANCGSGTVTLENQATAGLYNYTPYQPDDSALAQNLGPCSSFGNANFFGLFKAWFGDPRL